MLPDFPYPELVASTFCTENNRMVPGVSVNGPRVISFDAILRYGRFPLAQLIKEILEICKNELLCDVELEFAADVIPSSNGQGIVLKLLQVRPISEYSDECGASIEEIESSMSKTFVKSAKALGSGKFDDMKYIVMVPSASFDSARTREMAQEIARVNKLMKEEGASYLLVGPGRWGSSDPWLGIPVMWSDISEAKMIVETAIPGFRIEPSQGTHFFQNITSLGVGYLTIDTVIGDGMIDEDAISELECVHSNEFVKLFKAPEGFSGYIDRSTNESLIGF
jgi:hypothetical protein